MNRVPFEYYILQWDFNKHVPMQYNIFNSSKIYEGTLKAIKKYCRSPKKFYYINNFITGERVYGFPALCKELESIFREMWSRCEYEFVMSGLFYEDDYKVDGFYLVQCNIAVIARECIHTYKEWKKHGRADECNN